LVFAKADNVSTADDASDYDWAVFAIKSMVEEDTEIRSLLSDIDLMNRRAKLNLRQQLFLQKHLVKSLFKQLFS